MLANARAWFITAVAALLLVACATDDPAPPPAAGTIVQTVSGPVRAAVSENHRLFAGIPYAAPPLGPLRFRPPAPPPSWTELRDGSKYGPRCLQDVSRDPDFGRSVSEDCLTLNVWTPRTLPADTKLPVMVWIHGGAFVNGSADIYDGGWMVDRGVVVVSVNYRLGALGFLAHPALAEDGSPGNYGLLDQQAALRWVQNNIANFGGDPAKVTLAGESAGAMSVCDHLVAPGSAGLFRGAIIQSGPCQVQADRATAERVSVEYADWLGCFDPAKAASCLRGLPADRLESPPLYHQFGVDKITGPVFGTPVLPVDPPTAFREGRVPPVPVLIGTNRDEFTLFTALKLLSGSSLPPYDEALDQSFGPDDGGPIAAEYPLDRYGGSEPLAYSAATTDGIFACPSDDMAVSLGRVAPTFAYEFDDPDAPAPEPMQQLPFPVGASHALEMRYLFDGGGPPLNAAQRALSDQMLAYWTQFIVTGAPAVDGAPEWPAIGTDPAGRPRMSLRTDGSRVITDFDDEHRCEFWAQR